MELKPCESSETNDDDYEFEVEGLETNQHIGFNNCFKVSIPATCVLTTNNW